VTESNPPDSIPFPQPSTGQTAADLAQLNGQVPHGESESPGETLLSLDPIKFEPLTVNRIVNVYSTEWNGARPGIVVRVDPGRETCINIFLDGFDDSGVLSLCRNSRFGNSVIIPADVAARENAYLTGLLRKQHRLGASPLDKHKVNHWGDGSYVSVSYPFVPRPAQAAPKLPDFNDEQTTFIAAGIAAKALEQLKPGINEYITRTLAEWIAEWQKSQPIVVGMQREEYTPGQVAYTANVEQPGPGPVGRVHEAVPEAPFGLGSPSASLETPAAASEPAPETTSPHEPRPVGQVPEALPDPAPAADGDKINF
jgi:hypothetical protein